MTDLVLVGANESRGGGHWSYDDYDVRLGDANGRVVGKIFKAVTAPDGLNWLWTITERTPRKLTDRGGGLSVSLGAIRECPLLAQSGQSNRIRVCPLLDRSGQR